MVSYPPRELWPEKIYNLPELAYPDTFNACYELLDANLALGRASAPAISDVWVSVAQCLCVLRVRCGDELSLDMVIRVGLLTEVVAMALDRWRWDRTSLVNREFSEAFQAASPIHWSL